MKRLMSAIALAAVLTACSEDPARGAAEVCKREVESRSQNELGQAELSELIAAAKARDGGFQIDAYVYYRRGTPEQRRALFTCVVNADSQLQNLLIQPFPERF